MGDISVVSSKTSHQDITCKLIPGSPPLFSSGRGKSEANKTLLGKRERERERENSNKDIHDLVSVFIADVSHH